MTPIVAALHGLLGTPTIAASETQQERFATAFAEPQPETRAVCDAILRAPLAAMATDLAGDTSPSALPPADNAALPVEEPEAPPVPAVPESVPPPRFLASVGVSVQRTQYDARWRAVQEAGLSFECASFVVDRMRPPASPEELAAFNRLINRIVRYVPDGGEDGGPDEWASAADTLWSGQGDCEDIAILKLQLLLALGLPEDDVYFTLVRDSLRRRDHAVAVVRLGGRSWMLDSIDDALLDADTSAQPYQAVVAFSGAHKWLLGTERQALVAAP